jgi:glucosamine--fructose-6-phosphate aminotransferase (isomerizing)
MEIQMIDLSSNTYLHDILDQPLALSNTLKALSETNFSVFKPFYNQIGSGKLQRILLTGMGASFQLLYPIFYSLAEHGVRVQMLETSELIHYGPKLLDPSTLVVAVSQSGNSVEIIKLLEMTQGKIRLIGVTNTPFSVLATHADAVLFTDAGVEKMVSCKTYVAALAAMAVLSRILIGQEPYLLIEELKQAPESAANYLSHWEFHVKTALELVNGIQFIMLAGRGASLAAAEAGGLIIKEAGHFPAEGMSCAAFRHGPLDMMSSENLAVIYEGDERTAHLNTALVGEMHKAGVAAHLVRQSDEVNIFSLPRTSPSVLPIFEIMPAQMLSLALAVTRGHAPGHFKHISKVTETE